MSEYLGWSSYETHWTYFNIFSFTINDYKYIAIEELSNKLQIDLQDIVQNDSYLDINEDFIEKIDFKEIAKIIYNENNVENCDNKLSDNIAHTNITKYS
jgi:hypothetical protein